MSDGAHLLIPFASAVAEGCRQALAGLALPNLEKLLARLAPAVSDSGDAESLSMPHERVIAREAGLPVVDGCLPLAALQAQAGSGEPCAWITPCHWRVGTDHIVMGNPDDLRLEEAESRAILEAMAPFFTEDAIALDYDTPTRWLARGELFRELPSASLDRVAGRDLEGWTPRAPKAGSLRRLQQEMQMLLYTHEVNDAREARGLLPVNSFWVSGTGALPASTGAGAGWATRCPPAMTLRDPALHEDWPAWAAAWSHLDATECAALLARLDKGEAVSLTLCGERSAQTWHRRPQGGYLAHMSERLGSIFGGKRAPAALEQL